ncbi:MULTISPECIES: LuxR C-terminal-related transcriptional regulator [Salinivibrio]|jgi:LuxR family transcriptional regulator of csgAB operon|uniref:LuxR C-terminal-related transcriptional regulator n=2 Tax=Salinivibrio TaxID=51366 RepID=A0ABY7LEW9_9GAMM|nr:MULTISPECIES: LuxR C-terminal-related transcriptional regulator [Salinivibrio]ODQ00403.1 helix-turn-helix transcriptional regulator [Salinivibrio sp. DV]OOF22449.1 LuxR family transcriptional regulator [Salinivibrio sp. IB872]PCE68752.1 LuxR family transcriptional regulator [Salinivibrio sp. YCSC6]QCF36814.1 LuxR family transcriptional regulator [Salinivibrio sp. YCSC6]QIR05181.1 LuxR family transcriptional regulator [Salinivibrio costicola]
MSKAETTSDSYTLLLISQPSMSVSALIACLEKEIRGTVELVSPDTIHEKLTERSGLVLIDLSAFDDTATERLKHALTPYADQHVFALLNAHDLTAKELASWPFIKGVFKKDDELSHLCYGVEKMFSGEYWLPRHKMAALIHYYQQHYQQTIDEQAIVLTNREQEILRHLVTGASNQDIANALAVSEHTVKSHLYNVFKKINVKNRVQAVFWAKNNLSLIGSVGLELGPDSYDD